jgi:hypothetical protein
MSTNHFVASSTYWFEVSRQVCGHAAMPTAGRCGRRRLVRLTNGTRSARTGSNEGQGLWPGTRSHQTPRQPAVGRLVDSRRTRRRTTRRSVQIRYRYAGEQMCPTLWMTAWRRVPVVVSVPRHRCFPQPTPHGTLRAPNDNAILVILLHCHISHSRSNVHSLWTTMWTVLAWLGRASEKVSGRHDDPGGGPCPSMDPTR